MHLDGGNAQSLAADLLSGAGSVEVLEPDTPMKRKKRLDQECEETNDIGMYEAWQLLPTVRCYLEKTHSCA